MSEIEIIQWPDERLKGKATLVTEEELGGLQLLVHQMYDVLLEHKGVGLAASQIGDKRSALIYTKKDGSFKALFNAKIIAKTGSHRSKDEGCLSVRTPYMFRADVKRSKQVTVTAMDIHGEDVRIKETGHQAVILQHEIDHLNGIEFIDRVKSPEKKAFVRATQCFNAGNDWCPDFKCNGCSNYNVHIKK